MQVHFLTINVVPQDLAPIVGTPPIKCSDFVHRIGGMLARASGVWRLLVVCSSRENGMVGVCSDQI